MTTRYVYSARLVPIGQRVKVPKIDGTPWYTTFDARAFAVRTSPVDVCVDHDRDMVVGKVVQVYTTRSGWWTCVFTIDPDIPDVELEVGQNVSVDVDVLGDDEVPFLREVSIVARGAVKGAAVTSRDALEPVPPTGGSDLQSVAVGEVFYGDGTTITRYGIGQVLGLQ